MNTALRCALTAAVGILAFALPTLASVGCTPASRCVINTVPEPATIMLLAGGLATIIGARKFRRS
jgi:hypothetical protein